jgi:hypothetical protein
MADQLDHECVLLRHHRTEQTVMVTLGQYRQQASRRFRNWKLARGNVVLRPVLTLSECLADYRAEYRAECRASGG